MAFLNIDFYTQNKIVCKWMVILRTEVHIPGSWESFVAVANFIDLDLTS